MLEREGCGRLIQRPVMTRTLEQPIPATSTPRPNAYYETVIVSAGALIMLSVWPGEPGAPTVVFLHGTIVQPLFYKDSLDGLNRRGLSVVGVHYQGRGKSPRVGSRLSLNPPWHGPRCWWARRPSGDVWMLPLWGVR